jgi:hypothetical protein
VVIEDRFAEALRRDADPLDLASLLIEDLQIARLVVAQDDVLSTKMSSLLAQIDPVPVFAGELRHEAPARMGGGASPLLEDPGVALGGFEVVHEVKWA